MILIVMVGCYCSSKVIFEFLNRRDRLSVIMWGLVFFALFSAIDLVIEFVDKWGENGYALSELYQFHEVC